MIALLVALAPALGKLLELALADEHDEEAEMQALFAMQRAIHNERARRKFATPPEG